jgi:hypothetical protein
LRDREIFHRHGSPTKRGPEPAPGKSLFRHLLSGIRRRSA